MDSDSDLEREGEAVMRRKIRTTGSICPVCFRVISASIFEENGAIYMEKECPLHGYFSDILWSDAELYRRFESLDVCCDMMHLKAQHCPYMCGLCDYHASTTVLGVIDVTDRCNMRCHVCFADSGAGEREEPSISDVKNMIDALADSGAFAIQFSGGEPTLRDDLPDMIAYARKRVKHVQVDTNGIRMAESEDFCREMESAGLSVVYLQFDGVTESPYIKLRGRKMFDVKRRAIENHRKAGENPAIVLVPTVVRGVNDGQIGSIIKFAVENSDIIRGVNFQPISFCGRKGYDADMRITVSDVIAAAVNQTGFMRREDFFPPSAMSIMLSTLGGDVGCHHACGAFSYLFVRERGTPKPFTDYVNMNALIDSYKKNGKVGIYAMLRGSLKGSLKILGEALHSYFKLSELHRKMIFVGAMHFMDAFNFDLARARRCCIHYALPSGDIVPFCTYNIIHRRRARNLTPRSEPI